MKKEEVHLLIGELWKKENLEKKKILNTSPRDFFLTFITVKSSEYYYVN